MGFEPGRKTPDGYLAVPASGSGPGVLLLHAWWGLNDFYMELCNRLAEQGFVALAPDLCDGAIATTVDEAKKLVEIVDSGPGQTRSLSALDELKQNPAIRGTRIGVIGCSMGAYYALLLSALRPDDVAAVVDYYGVVEGPDYTTSRAAYLGHCGEDDQFDPFEAAQAMEAEMRAASRDATFYGYPGAGHWFIEEDRPDAYHPESARLAWERTSSFLRDHLRP